MSDINHSRRGFLRGRLRSVPAPQRPPWALPEAEFLARCTRCNNCAIICPSKIIQIRDGYPQINFSLAGCTFCAECVRVCAPAALRRESPIAPPWQVKAQIGEACMALQGIECRICGDQCEVSAIRFVPRLRSVAIPELNLSACTGCGGCVAACPPQVIQMR